MAKINTFFIRASAQATALSSFDQVEIDLGSFVDALGQSILRIHRVDVSIRDSLVPQRTMMCDIAGSGSITWQLTTQTKTAPVFATYPTNRTNIVSCGCTMVGIQITVDDGGAAKCGSLGSDASEADIHEVVHLI